MKEVFNDKLMQVDRGGITGLIHCMEEGGFYEAPCSGSHHLAKPGGLVEHSLNVLEMAEELNEALQANIDYESIVICSLLHDLGKMGDRGKPNYVENILKSGARSDAKPYVTNSELVYIPHEIRSVMIAERHIYLSEQEEQAILWHNGLYGQFRNEIQGKETPLYMILHWADMWASRVLEQED